MNELSSAPSAESEEDVTTEALIEAVDLIEEISIDGMCGVY
ncbi:MULTISPECIES: mycofactocin precursor MftA [unclassified Streptomyces]|nr:mycofactocin precursor MftA [Streptomyces sp. NBC_01429]